MLMGLVIYTACITTQENSFSQQDILRAALISLHDRESNFLPIGNQVTNRRVQTSANDRC